MALKTDGRNWLKMATAARPMTVWTAPPTMMPAVAAMPARRPPTSALASTNIMSMPGTMMMPTSSTK